MWKARKELEAADVKFEPGLNEDLAATALWGTQQVNLHGEGRVQGVFGLWYGKGPGVDRCGDVFRHANMAGTAEFGGVVACLGDDHTGESSTVLHHSEFALVDAMMPILSPAGVQEVLDYGLLGWALSRYTGCWVGLKCVKDTIEVTEVVDGDPHRLEIVTPHRLRPARGRPQHPPRRHPRRPGGAPARLQALRRRSLCPRERNRPPRPRRTPGRRSASSPRGKSWLDTTHALDLLGIDAAEAERLGITTYKVGMVWPLDMASFREWAHDLEHIIVVEEKRKLIEVQIKEAIFDDRRGRRVTGWKNEAGETIFSVKQALDPVKIARTLGTLLAFDGVEIRGPRRPPRAPRRRRARRQRRGDRRPQALVLLRLPAQHLDPPARGRPRLRRHRLPLHGPLDGPRRPRNSPTWAARAPTGSARRPSPTAAHVFQNLGDGTYNHSGVQAIRAALAAGVNITYKILFNDAVAMTGGQPNEGGLTAQQIANELVAMGVKHVVGVYDPKEEIDLKSFPRADQDARARRARRRPARDAGGPRRLRHHLHPDLRRREAPPPQARRVPRPRPPRLHQPRRLRRLRRLRRAVELRLDPAARDRVRPQAH